MPARPGVSLVRSLRIFSAWLPATHTAYVCGDVAFDPDDAHTARVNFRLCRIFYLLSTRNSITTDKLSHVNATHTRRSACEYPRELFVPLSIAVLTY